MAAQTLAGEITKHGVIVHGNEVTWEQIVLVFLLLRQLVAETEDLRAQRLVGLLTEVAKAVPYIASLE